MSHEAQLLMGITWGILVGVTVFCVWRLNARRR